GQRANLEHLALRVLRLQGGDHVAKRALGGAALAKAAVDTEDPDGHARRLREHPFPDHRHRGQPTLRRHLRCRELHRRCTSWTAGRRVTGRRNGRVASPTGRPAAPATGRRASRYSSTMAAMMVPAEPMRNVSKRAVRSGLTMMRTSVRK